MPGTDRVVREARRRLGSYYTPAPVADYLVRATLAPLLASLGRAGAMSNGGHLDDILMPRVLDPAMGDGGLLSIAADLIAGTLADGAGLELGEVRPLVVARCLCGVDIDPAAVSLARRSLGRGAERAELLHDDFIAEGAPVTGPFDAVLGNPPWGGWNRMLGPEAKLELRARFATARGLIDPFALFLERCTGMLEPGGRLGMVLPDYFLLKNYPAIRRLVLDSYAIEELAHWGRVFPDVNVDACTIVATRTARPGRGTVRCLPEGTGGRVVKVPQSRFMASPGHAFNLSLDGREAALLQRLRKRCVALGELMETHEGIHTGNIRDRLFIPPAARTPGSPARGPARARPGRARRLILGRREIRPFLLRPAGWRVVYDPRAIRRASGEYANLGRERWFTGPKILVRRTGDVVMAVLDRDGYFASNNLFVALRRRGCGVPLEYLEAYLNSALATWCFRAVQPRAGRLFAELKLNHLNGLPVPVPRGASGRLAMARVARLAGRLRSAAASGRDTAALQKELDAGFSRLAGLTAAETRIVGRKTFTPPGATPL